MKMRNFLLEDFYEKYEFSTKYLLSQSDCESMTVDELLQMEPDAKQRFMQSSLGYTEVKGSPELRAHIAALYESCGPDDILVHAGAEEAIFSFMQVFLTAGAHVVYMSPAYQSLYEVATALGCEVSSWQMRQGDSGWTLNMDELISLIKPSTKLIVLNTPHNPTGYSLSDEELRLIADIARERGIFVFCDQVYKGLEWDGQAHSWMSDLYENAVSLGVMSKAYGLPGLRIGWIATRNKDVFDKMVKYKYYTTICCSAPSEFLSIVALKHSDDILRRNISIIEDNITYAEPFFSKYADVFIDNVPAAGPIAFHMLKMPGGIRAFCEDLIQNKGVLLLPADVYEVNGDYFRMGYGRKNFKECLNHLDEYLSVQ
jgi:aspartate/methionine/tyrosine aminotransferase